MLSPKFKSFLRDYFTLTSRERNGALILATIILIQCGVLTWFHYRPTRKLPEIERYQLAIHSFTDSIRTSEQKKTSAETTFKSYSPFNPNSIGKKEWMAFGLSDRQADVILNYLSRGGVFRDKEDVRKMFVISDEIFRQIESFITIPPSQLSSKQPSVPKEKQKPPIVELNSADTLQLNALPLIGAGRARLIFKYRELLGGFHSIDQLYEVFTIDSSVVNAIRDRVTIDQSRIRKFNINGDELKHPYLRGGLAKTIISYRKQHGNFSTLQDVEQVKALDPETLNKLVPYLGFE